MFNRCLTCVWKLVERGVKNDFFCTFRFQFLHKSFCRLYVSYDVIAKFNETLAMIPADQKEELFVTDGTHYNTCTLWATTCFEPGETACIIHIGGSEKHLVELMCEYIDYDGIARPILAF